MSNGVTLKEVPAGGKGDRSQGDMHAFGNPHFTLNPQIAQRMAATLVKAMMTADPANADLYKKNAITFVNGNFIGGSPALVVESGQVIVR